MARLLRIKRRIGGTPGPPDVLERGEPAYNDNGDELFIGTGTDIRTLVSAERQLELDGDQVIGIGVKTFTTGNFRLTGGIAGDVLTTDGSGNVDWAESTGGAQVEVGAIPPTSPDPGHLWWNTEAIQLFIWTGLQWVVTVNQPIDVWPGEPPADNVVYGRRNSGTTGDWQRALAVAGGTMAGPLYVLPPSDPAHPATKLYVDNARLDLPPGVVLGAGGAAPMGGDMGAGTVNVRTGFFINGVSVGAGGGTWPGEPPADGFVYGRTDDGTIAGWSRALPISGGILTGPLLLAANPTPAADEAVPRQYVDDQIATPNIDGGEF